VRREERLVREVEARRAALSHEQAELFTQMKNELLRCQSRLLEVERDRDRGWDLARHWNQRAHELRHAALTAQSMVATFCAHENLAPPSWPDMSVTNLEDPRP
jgi:predicted Holliday junction resolvase-like endonuclease